MPCRARWKHLGLLALVAYGVFGIKLANSQLQKSPAAPFDRAEMLAHLAYHIMLPAYLDFADAAEALQGATVQLCEAPTVARLETAQARWRQAALQWKRSEAFQLNLTQIYAQSIGYWPTRERRIRQALMSEEPITPAYVEAMGTAAHGLSAAVMCTSSSRWQQRVGLTLALLYLMIQCVVPLRSYIYRGRTLWTENGMRFAWRVMLVEKTGHVDFEVREAPSGRVQWVSPEDYLTPRQAKMMATRPAMIQQFAQMIARDFRQQGWWDVSVHAAAYVSLNGRPSQRFIDFEADLAQRRQALSEAIWILPLQDAVPIRLRAMRPRSVSIRSP